MHFPKDLGTWGFILSIVAIVLMYPVGLLINITTPIVQNWIASRTKQSLVNRIERLEKELAELESNPPIEEVEDRILWGLKSIRILIFSAMGLIVGMIYMGVRILNPATNSDVNAFTYFSLFVMISTGIMQLRLRYSHDFRTERSPRRRKGLRKAIDDLKQIQASWP